MKNEKFGIPLLDKWWISTNPEQRAASAGITGSVIAGFWVPACFLIAVGALSIYLTQTKNIRFRKHAEKVLSEPIGMELPEAAVKAIEALVYLKGTTGHPGRVVTNDSFVDNWLVIAEEVEVTGKEITNYAIDLVCDPKNQEREHAVLATMGGLVLGWIPNGESTELFDFLMSNGGVGRANA